MDESNLKHCFVGASGGILLVVNKMIQLTKIKKTYQTSNGLLCAVDTVSVQVCAGEIFGFIGFSGAGKSTLLRCINLLEKPDNGEVWVDGENFMLLSKKELMKQRRKIGIVFQHYNLLQNATVFENAAFPLEIAKTAKIERRRRVLQCLEIVGLSEKAGDYPSKLSGGQKQRVAIARAIVTNPKILLCDEPTSALDPQTTQIILQYLQLINKELGITIVLVTHEMGVVRTICDRVSVMEKGKLIETLDMSETDLSPQSELAKFLFINGGGI
ncbi:MAG: ATP-binding cassette domain-containing protein [Planctomycetaceae bacterium]|jgi:D-methionine transport system ATP-binding protein|nr:ATP-binding cassette domain-containing protein [Planctomycetaceae bacterium]